MGDQKRKEKGLANHEQRIGASVGGGGGSEIRRRRARSAALSRHCKPLLRLWNFGTKLLKKAIYEFEFTALDKDIHMLIR